ncbi:Inosine-uridine preferring nucleoside hydrolase [Trichuris suis]|nr:Inosine-uridine preferring nucleoside hydrolase [Trichuris suis]
MSTRKKVDLIIDADTAGDDVASLVMACLHPNVRLLAVTVCMGNVDFDQQIRNTLYTLEQCDAEQRVRVYAGSRQPLEGTIQLATEVHGIDGMGDSNFPPPLRATIVTDEDAVSALIRLTGERPGQLTILAQAPLTNVAKAVMRDPNFARNTGRLFIMGGTYFCRGNVTPAAEYNFFADPKAACIVLQAGFAQCYLVDWGVCVRDGLWDFPFLDRLANSNAKLAKFILSVIRRNVEFCKTAQRIDGSIASDSLAMAVIADESICRGWIRCYMQVETTGQLTRGATVVDSLDERVNVHVCGGVDSVAYKTMIYDILTRRSNST